MSKPKYYHYTELWDTYRVQRMINGKRISYGTYHDEADAEKVVSELIKVDWNREELPRILKELGIQSKIINEKKNEGK